MASNSVQRLEDQRKRVSKYRITLSLLPVTLLNIQHVALYRVFQKCWNYSSPKTNCRIESTSNERLLRGSYNYDSTSIRPSFDCRLLIKVHFNGCSDVRCHRPLTALPQSR